MPPITRAAARSQSDKQASTKVKLKPKPPRAASKVIKSAPRRKKTASATAMATGKLAPAPEPAPAPGDGTFELNPEKSIMEWYSLEAEQDDTVVADDGGHGDDTDWTGILKEVRQHQGCLFAGRSTSGSVCSAPPTNSKEWTIIGKLLNLHSCLFRQGFFADSSL